MKFHAGDFSLDDAPWLVDQLKLTDEIKTLIEDNQCYTTWEIADILKISKSINLLVKMEKVYFILQNKNVDFLANLIL